MCSKPGEALFFQIDKFVSFGVNSLTPFILLSLKMIQGNSVCSFSWHSTNRTEQDINEERKQFPIYFAFRNILEMAYARVVLYKTITTKTIIQKTDPFQMITNCILYFHRITLFP